MNARFADRSERSKLRVSGEQGAWFLDQILTQAIEDIPPGGSRDAAMITVKGRMRFFFEIVVRAENDLLLHLEPGLAQSSLEELRRYVFATRVTLEDVTGEFALILVLAEPWREIAEETGVDGLVLHPTLSFGAEAGYVWAPEADRQLLMGRLAEAGVEKLTDAELEAIRIKGGAPRWGKDMDESTFPQEAGIDGRAVHYQKGCYLGQEAMAKIHFRGKVNRRLATLEGDEPLSEGGEILVDGVKVGVITSASGTSALGYVKHTVQEGAEGLVDNVKVRVDT